MMSITDEIDGVEKIQNENGKEIATKVCNSSGIRFRLIKTYQRFRPFTFVLVLGIYALLGGLIFSYLEGKHEIEMNIQKTESLNVAAKNLTWKILSVLENEIHSKEMKFDQVLQLINQYQQHESLFPNEKLSWSLLGGIFFAGTIFTTIGYGNMHPFTQRGRIAVMVYAFFGIPMMLFVVADIGKSLTKMLNLFWMKVKHSTKNRGQKFSRSYNSNSIMSNSNYVDEEVYFPVIFVILLAFTWNFICAGVFCIWEKSWSYFDAFYFFFISLSTIGLGDVMPEHTEYMIFNPLVVIGLCLVSIVVHLLQCKLEKGTNGCVRDFDHQPEEKMESEKQDLLVKKG